MSSMGFIYYGVIEYGQLIIKYVHIEFDQKVSIEYGHFLLIDSWQKIGLSSLAQVGVIDYGQYHGVFGFIYSWSSRCLSILGL